VKKILFLILFLTLIIFPVIVFGQSGTLDNMMQRLKDTAVSIIAPMVAIGWIITGILYLTAAGAPERLGTAQKALIACVIGTLVIALAESGAIIGLIQNAFGIEGQ